MFHVNQMMIPGAASARTVITDLYVKRPFGPSCPRSRRSSYCSGTTACRQSRRRPIGRVRCRAASGRLAVWDCGAAAVAGERQEIGIALREGLGLLAGRVLKVEADPGRPNENARDAGDDILAELEALLGRISSVILALLMRVSASIASQLICWSEASTSGEMSGARPAHALSVNATLTLTATFSMQHSPGRDQGRIGRKWGVP